MPVQDDERERELVRMFNLSWNPAHQRAGVDAELVVEVDSRTLRFEVEVKSTTGATVSTARDVGMEHIRRWRRMLFVVGFYSRDAGRPELKTSLCLTPLDMEPWIASIEDKIRVDFTLAERSSRKLDLDDLFEVCGEKAAYTMADAKRLHKSQWTSAQYEAALDTEEGSEPRISRQKMLEILQLRSKYIAQRGATLNNPHVPQAHLKPFFGTDRQLAGGAWAAGIRTIAVRFAREHDGHPAIHAG